MRTSLARTLCCFVLAAAVLTPTTPVLAQAALGDNALSFTDQDFVSQLYQEIVASQRLATMAVNDGKKSSVRSLGASTTGFTAAGPRDGQTSRPEEGRDDFRRSHRPEPGRGGQALQCGRRRLRSDLSRRPAAISAADSEPVRIRGQPRRRIRISRRWRQASCPSIKSRIAAVESVKSDL